MWQAILGGLGLLGSAASAAASVKNTKDTNRTNQQIASDANQTQIGIARENNEMQERMNRYNNEFAREVAIEMFNLENDYNTPARQVERLKAAGLNPATFYAGSSVANTGDASTPSAASSGVSPSMPNLSVPQMLVPPTLTGTLFSSIESFGRSLEHLSKAGLDSSQKAQIDSLLSDNLRKAVAEADNAELSNRINEFGFALDKIYGLAQRDASLRKTVNEAAKLYNDGLLAVVKQDTERSQQLLNKANELLSASKDNLLQQQLPSLVAQSEALVELTKEQRLTERSKQNQLAASAEESRSRVKLTEEQTSQLRSMRDDNIRLQKSIADDKSINVKYLSARLMYEVELLRKRGVLADNELDLYKQRIEHAEKENDAFWFKTLFGDLNETIETGIHAGTFMTIK